MNNLLEIGISKETIDKMIEKTNIPTIENLDCNAEEVKQIIDLLKNYNINNIDDILINYSNIFYEDCTRIKECLSKHDPNEVANNINTDPSYLMEIVYED